MESQTKHFRNNPELQAQHQKNIEDNYKGLTAQFKERREQLKLSQEALSEMTGIPQKTISRLETGRMTKLTTILSLGQAMGLHLTFVEKN